MRSGFSAVAFARGREHTERNANFAPVGGGDWRARIARARKGRGAP